MLRAVSRAAAAVALATRLLAQNPILVPAASTDVLHSAGREVTVGLLTMGNGDRVWELFGHTAIWLRDSVTGRDTVFNWGVFDSRQPHFIVHFLQGLNLYRMGGETISYLLAEYRHANRSVVLQDLDLTAAQKDSLLSLIRTNAQPEHVEYRYDYFRDNCSTRPRDLLDHVLGGRLRAAASQTMPTSYRWHTLRLMQGGKLLMLGGCAIRIFGETRPCERMEEAQPGLRQALRSGWRGGVFGEIVESGSFRVGERAELA